MRTGKRWASFVFKNVVVRDKTQWEVFLTGKQRVYGGDGKKPCGVKMEVSDSRMCLLLLSFSFFRGFWKQSPAYPCRVCALLPPGAKATFVWIMPAPQAATQALVMSIIWTRGGSNSQTPIHRSLFITVQTLENSLGGCSAVYLLV